MDDDWMTDAHKAAALEGFRSNPVAQAYARQIADDERRARLAAAMVAWVREQVVADHEAAQALHNSWWIDSDDDETTRAVQRFTDPNTVLARCDAYTAILDRWVVGASTPENKISSFVRGQDDGYQQGCLDAIRDIAVSMADRPGFREEWRPGER